MEKKGVPSLYVTNRKDPFHSYYLSKRLFDTASPEFYVAWCDQSRIVVMVDDNLKELELAIQQRIKSAMLGYREEHHLTQEEMAEFLGISHKNYSSYESRDDRWVPNALIVRFCDRTDTSLMWIYRGTPPRIPRPTKSPTRRKS